MILISEWKRQISSEIERKPQIPINKVIEIDDFRNFIYEYLWYIEPDKYVRCVGCGLLIKLANNKNKYCRCCAREKQLEWQRESMKKLRSKNM